MTTCFATANETFTDFFVSLIMVQRIAFILLSSFLLLGGDNYIEWSADRKLEWDDFRGPVDEESSFAAHTWSKISLGWDCDDDVFTFTAVAKFDKDQSWKRDNISPKLLAHEQLHFDITELYARRMRKHFQQVPDGCALSNEEVESQFNAILKDWRDRQKLYDKETAHSKNQAEQARWEQMVAGELKTLSKYAVN